MGGSLVHCCYIYQIGVGKKVRYLTSYIIDCQMQAFFLCWMFDSRWLCKITNPCLQFMNVIPITINITTIIGVILERSLIKMEVDSYFILLMVFYGLLASLGIYLLIATYQAAQKKSTIGQNQNTIRLFQHNFELRKGIWGWTGLLTSIISIAQMIINHLYINSNRENYECIVNITRFYLDLAGWAYIVLVIVLFLIFKLVFLLFAWRNPETYLKYKSVI